MRKLLASSLLAALAGCGPGGPDITGMYRMTSSYADGTGCGPGASQTTPAFFLVTSQSLLGVPFYSFKSCTSMDQSTCQSGFGLLSEPIPNGWRGELTFSSGDSASCSLGYTNETAVAAGRSLRYERRTYSQSNVMGTSCMTSDAKSRGSSMPCTGYVLLVGDHL